MFLLVVVFLQWLLRRLKFCPRNIRWIQDLAANYNLSDVAFVFALIDHISRITWSTLHVPWALYTAVESALGTDTKHCVSTTVRIEQ